MNVNENENENESKSTTSQLKPKPKHKTKKRKLEEKETKTENQKQAKQLRSSDETKNEQEEQEQEETKTDMDTGTSKDPKLLPLTDEEQEQYLIRFQMNPERSRIFMNICEAIAQVEDGEVNFLFTREGMNVSIMDASKVSCTRAKLGVEFWDAYEYIIPDDTHGIRVQLKVLCESLKIVKQQATHTCFALRKEKQDYLFLTIWNDVTMHHQLPLLSLSDDQFSIPDMDFKLKFDVNSSWIKNMMNGLKTMSDVMTLQRKPPETQTEVDFVLQFQDDTKGSKEVRFPLSKIENLHWAPDASADFKSRFAIKYVTKYLDKAPTLSSTVTFSMLEDHPLQLHFTFKQSAIEFYFWIAPKVE